MRTLRFGHLGGFQWRWAVKDDAGCMRYEEKLCLGMTAEVFAETTEHRWKI